MSYTIEKIDGNPEYNLYSSEEYRCTNCDNHEPIMACIDNDFEETPGDAIWLCLKCVTKIKAHLEVKGAKS